MLKGFSALSQQYWDELIGVNPAAQRLDHRQSGAQSRRTLLAVEAQAQQARLAGEAAKQQFIEFTQAHLHEQVADEVLRKLANIEQVSSSLFELGEAFFQLLDRLSSPSVTLNALDPLVHQIDWLQQDLLKLVNQPQYRNRTKSGALIKDIKTGLRFLGLETLQSVVPVYGLRRSLPHSTDPFIALKMRIWDHSLATALAARKLAEQSAELPYAAFCIGLYHSLGHMAVCRNYLRTYQQVRQGELLKARNERHYELTDALDNLTADGSFLSSLLQEFAAILSADLTARWGLKRLALCQTLDLLAEDEMQFSQAPLSQLVRQAQVYVQTTKLWQQQKLSSEERLSWLQQAELSTEQCLLLDSTDLSRLAADS
ncbi:HDOD domain-containing protein [Arsukibacterium sp.]|uniref:HDOD domain-containing protein n=1 Tax=Arsukibacterium sp. TaxID=1977258 RepID=UPI002FDAD0F5